MLGIRGGPISEREAQIIIQKLAKGLKLLYDRRIIHRDLNVNNVMLHLPELEPNAEDLKDLEEYLLEKLYPAREKMLKDLKNVNFQVKIIDYGISRTIDPGSVAETPCGTKELVAPELLQGRGYDFRVDVWNLGVMMYMLVTCAVPF